MIAHSRVGIAKQNAQILRVAWSLVDIKQPRRLVRLLKALSYKISRLRLLDVLIITW